MSSNPTLDRFFSPENYNNTVKIFELTDNLESENVSVSVYMFNMFQPLLNPNYHKGKKDWVLQNKLAVNQRFYRGDIVTFM